MDYTSHPKDRPRIFKGQIYTGRNRAMGSGDLQRNLPQLDLDGFNKLLVPTPSFFCFLSLCFDVLWS